MCDAGICAALELRAQSCMGHEASLGIGRQYSIKYPATMIFFNCHTGFRFSSRVLYGTDFEARDEIVSFFLEL